MIVNGEEIPTRKAYITEEITDYAIEFIQNQCKAKEKKTKPFCIFISHRPGHPPYQSPEDVSGMYDGEDVKGLLPEHVDPWWYGKARRNNFEGVMSGSYYDRIASTVKP